MEGSVVAQPMNELAVRNSKYASECVELHLAKRNISMLADRDLQENDFSRFVNLEVLWCNGNRLIKLDGLDANFRMKILYAHDNRISTLRDSSLLCMTFLSVLNLANNRLTDFKLTLSVLRRQNHLVDLDLSGNPLSEEKDYRLHVVKQIPWLQRLDKHVVTDLERKAAQRLKPLDTQIDIMAVSSSPSGGGKGDGGEKATEQALTRDAAGGATAAVTSTDARGGDGGGDGGEVVASNGAIDFAATTAAVGGEGRQEQEEEEEEAAEKDSFLKTVVTLTVVKKCVKSTELLSNIQDKACADTLHQMKLKVKEKRICLKPHFIELDPRNEEVLRDDEVIEVLYMYDLWPTTTLFDENKKPKKVKKRGSSGGGENGEDEATAAYLGSKGEGYIPGLKQQKPFTVEQERLLLMFSVAKPPTRSKKLGRDAKVLEAHEWSDSSSSSPSSPSSSSSSSAGSSSVKAQSRARLFVDYVKLCRALEPRCNKRDSDERERRLEVEWKKPLPAKTTIQRLLEAEVAAYRKELAVEEEQRRQAMVHQNEDGGDGEDGGGTAKRQTDNKSGSKSGGGGGGGGSGPGFDHNTDLTAPELSAWEVHAFSRFLISVEEKRLSAIRAKKMKERLDQWQQRQQEKEAEGGEGNNGDGGDNGGEEEEEEEEPPSLENLTDEDLGVPFPTGALTKAELVACLEQMHLLGRVYFFPDENTPATASSNGGGEAAVAGAQCESGAQGGEDGKELLTDRIFRALDLSLSASAGGDGTNAAAAAGGHDAKKRASLSPLAAFGGGSGASSEGKSSYPWKAFFKAVVYGLEDQDTALELLPALRWGPLGVRACVEKASELFADAHLIQRRVLTGHENPSDISTMAELSTHGTRLRKIAAQAIKDAPSGLSLQGGGEWGGDDNNGAGGRGLEAKGLGTLSTGAGGSGGVSNLTAATLSKQQQQQQQQAGVRQGSIISFKGAMTVLVGHNRFAKNKHHNEHGESDDGEEDGAAGGAFAALSASSSHPGPESLLSDEEKRARKLEMLRRKFRLSKQDAEAMLKNNSR